MKKIAEILKDKYKTLYNQFYNGDKNDLVKEINEKIKLKIFNNKNNVDYRIIKNEENISIDFLKHNKYDPIFYAMSNNLKYL